MEGQILFGLESTLCLTVEMKLVWSLYAWNSMPLIPRPLLYNLGMSLTSINICMWSSPVPMQCVPRTMYVRGRWHVSEEESPPNQDPILSLPSRCCPWKAPILFSIPSTPSVSWVWLYAYHYCVHIFTQLGTDISSVMSMEVATGDWPKSREISDKLVGNLVPMEHVIGASCSGFDNVLL